MELHSLPADTIDLIATAAIDFGVITARPGEQRPQRLIRATAHRIGTALYMRNRHRHPSGYLFQPVETSLDIRDVIKACHAAQFAFSDTKDWNGCVEQQVVEAVAKAASMRIPGYANSPWLWRRPQENAIAYASQWHPNIDVDELRWVETTAELFTRWDSANLVFLAWDILTTLPALAPRPRVWTIAPADNAPEATELAARFSLEGALMWPQARAWLEQRVGG